ncbi:hypothetical protein [Ornithinibacillus halotolerans]|uniref:ParB/Sulfiredoxin domain-containing protein n=1 Tax=Ornithinibacillus halotolerans TaxID=1274357 RepID=A0A916WDS3_9BACI|nr:hypothetical protein [Ornithinibacillus halotolerans]GGA91405.1 hypothetical protein GCM10008025_37410 [Ornithinibacillus halotolerans]
MNKSRKLKLQSNYTPYPINDEDDEVYRNGIFQINITKIIEQIRSGKLLPEKEQIHVQDWFKTHFHGSINEDHLPSVDVTKTIIQAEISPDMYTIMGGNHRVEKAYREGTPYIDSFKLRVEQILPYFKETRGYETFVGYWNSKVDDKELGTNS